ncbi:MAG: hypothetical protein ACM3SO_03710 [Betaproteobacteria bacterium]
MSLSSRLLAAVALGLPFVAQADPDDYVRTPTVEYGEREIDIKYGTARFKDAGERESAGSIALGWGVKPWWFTEAYLKFEKEGAERTKYDALEWENVFQVTEPNQYPVDLGFLLEIEIPRERHAEGYEFRFGPLFQAYTGPVRWNANVLLLKHVRAHDEDEPNETQLGYQLQARYDFSREFGIGAQAFGELGKWNHWAPASEQSHRVGPAIFGRVKLEGRNVINYNAAYLLKASDAAPDNTFRVQVEYEF